KMSFLFFWGHQPARDGSVTQSCFSQWWHAPFEVAGQHYATAEHWMMAGKASMFNDKDTEARILAAKSPAEAKKLGRDVRGFDPTVWDEQKFALVTAGNFHKFNQHEALRGFLLGTGDRILVEASPVDPVWGIGLAADDEHAANPLLWKGENLLGFALMEVRDRLGSSLK
ncbi:MAG: NADAR family protein, partial [Sphingobacteriales bacterium]